MNLEEELIAKGYFKETFQHSNGRRILVETEKWKNLIKNLFKQNQDGLKFSVISPKQIELAIRELD